MADRIPIVIITGYLGAGKTTLLREVVPQLVGSPRPPYVILNDFANAEVDSALLRQVAPEVKPISGGCICCDSSASLVIELGKVPAELNPIVFIEANGTTDPFPLIELITLNPTLVERFGPIYQITVVNESRWQKRLFSWDKKIERAQAATASHLITNRSEKASLKQQFRVKTDLQALNPHAIRTTAGEFIAELLAITRESTATLNPAEPIGHAHHHLALRLDLPPISEDALVRWLLSFPPEVLRIKGLAQLIDDPIDNACFFQRTDDEWGNPSLIKTYLLDGAESCAVFIGNGMDEKKIRASVGTFLYPPTLHQPLATQGIPSITDFLAKRSKWPKR